MAYEYILYEVRDKIATVTLNRPETFNAMGPAMVQELIDVFDETDGDGLDS